MIWFTVYFVYIPDGQETHQQMVQAKSVKAALKIFWAGRNSARVEVQFVDGAR